jgi:hypothetical protein
MRIVSAERVKKLKEAKAEREAKVVVEAESSPPTPTPPPETPKPKVRKTKKPRDPPIVHEAKPVVYPESIESGDDDPLPNPVAVLSIQKERMKNDVDEIKEAQLIEKQKAESKKLATQGKLERAAKRRADAAAAAAIPPKPTRVFTKTKHVYDNVGIKPVLLGKFV